jgi:hypothetical protein
MTSIFEKERPLGYCSFNISQFLVISLDNLNQGFSTFWYSRTPKSKLYPSAYPVLFAYPQIKNSTQISFIWVRFF